MNQSDRIRRVIQRLEDHFGKVAVNSAAPADSIARVTESFSNVPDELLRFFEICDGISVAVEDDVLGILFSISESLDRIAAPFDLDPELLGISEEEAEQLKAKIPDLNLDPSVSYRFKGGARDEEETIAFLKQAFTLALAMIAMILVTQFNSLFQAFLILTAVVFSTGGVLLGLLVTNQAFSLVNCGIGAIALAGIVVNNNIVLIDTFNRVRATANSTKEAIMRTCAQRMRPVMLTTVTTVLGLMPMAIGLNIDVLNRDVFFGGPSTQWWKQMASSIAGGLIFATILTLVLTPSLLMIQGNISQRIRERRARKNQAAGDTASA